MFSLKFDSDIREVEKIKQQDFTSYHHQIIGNLKYEDKKLFFQDDKWTSMLLGAGEEKAVYCVCDHNNKVFALEIIDEKHYLNGRLIDGEYFFQKRIGNLVDVKFNPQSLIGLTFTGLIKVREFIYGHEWARFQFKYDEKGWIDKFLTFILQSRFIGKFKSFEERYKDVHDRNVMFEFKDKREKGAAVIYLDSNKKLRLGKVSIKAIDVR